ncbi:MAG TPA: NAD(P)-dependent oxidoreductase [Mycobacteriales bacterium]|jgi:3-hydroxyisobutyrate dehydrogenase and related beta-hydroxyacid dehydrogenases
MAVSTGFVGLGLMGAPMARNLLRAGFPLTVWNRTRDRAEALARDGATVVARPREIGATAEVVVTVLSDDAAVEDVLFGPEGVVQGMRPGGTILDMSTTSPGQVISTAERLAERDIGFIDAPFFGSTDPARSGDLWVTVGAEDADLERVRPHLDAMCGTVFHMGPVGAGSVMKLCGNLIGTGMQGLLAEAFALGRVGGLDLRRMLEVIQTIDCAAPMFDVKGAQVVEEDYAPRFPLKHALKESRLARDLGETYGVRLNVTRGVCANLDVAARAGYADEDVIAVLKALPREQVPDPAGLPTRRR